MADPTDSQDGEAASVEPDKLDLRTALELLFGASAALAALVYLLLNATYLEFYESLGTRPEDVGLDRLAVLGRASGLAALLLYLSPLFVLPWLRRRLRERRATAADRSPDGEPASSALDPFTLLWYGLAFALPLIAFAAIWIAVSEASSRAELAEAGREVDPIRFLGFTLFSISADPARAIWLDDVKPQPAVLDDPWLLYLGRSADRVVFLACGRSLVLPADLATAEVLTTKEDALVERKRLPKVTEVEVAGVTDRGEPVEVAELERADVCEVLRHRDAVSPPVAAAVAGPDKPKPQPSSSTTPSPRARTTTRPSPR